MARPEFDPPWGEQPGAVLIDLPRLDGVAVEAIVRGVARGKPVPGEVLRHIARHSDGVPLYVEESTRAVLESGALQEHDHHWTLAGPLGSGVIPASLDASLMARIDRLGDARATAQLAATIGREFSYALLRAVSARDDEALRDDLRQIVDAGLAWRTPTAAGETYLFKHVLVQLAAYESLLRSTRQRYHERIADVLRRDFADEARTRPEVVARHLSGAGQPAEASDYWRAAGEKALARLAVPEAHGHFARGLEDLAGVPESDATLARELELQIAVAPTLMTVNGWASPTVARACERARELALRLGRPDKLYPPLWGLWTNLFVGGRLDRALDTARDALAMAGVAGVPMLAVTARHAMAYSHYYRGEWSEAVDHARAGLALYEVEQERALTATFQISSSVNMVAALGSSLWMLGHQDDGLRELDRMVAMARELNHPSALANALGVACYMLTFHHDAPRMKRHADEVKGFAREEGGELWYAVGVLSSGWARLRMGEGAASLAELFEGVALFRATGSDLMGPTVAVVHAEGLRAAGRPAEALAMLEETAATAQRGHVGVLLPDVHRIAGEIHLAAGALDEAEAALRRALGVAAGQQALSLELRAALALHPLLERTGRGDEARALVRRLYGRFEDSRSQPELRRARALLGAVVRHLTRRAPARRGGSASPAPSAAAEAAAADRRRGGRRRDIALEQPPAIGDQPAGDQRHHRVAERRVLEVDLPEGVLVDAQHDAVAAAQGGQRAPPVGREEGDLAEHAARLDELADLDELDASLDQQVDVHRPVAAAEQHLAGLQPHAPHVGLEPDARQVAVGDGCRHLPRQPRHLQHAPEVDRQQRGVQHDDQRRAVQQAVDDEAEVAADGQPAQRHHRLHERAGDDQRDADRAGRRGDRVDRRVEGLHRPGSRLGEESFDRDEVSLHGPGESAAPPRAAQPGHDAAGAPRPVPGSTRAGRCAGTVRGDRRRPRRCCAPAAPSRPARSRPEGCGRCRRRPDPHPLSRGRLAKLPACPIPLQGPQPGHRSPPGGRASRRSCSARRRRSTRRTCRCSPRAACSCRPRASTASATTSTCC